MLTYSQFRDKCIEIISVSTCECYSRPDVWVGDGSRTNLQEQVQEECMQEKRSGDRNSVPYPAGGAYSTFRIP